MTTGATSLWQATAGVEPRRPALEHDLDVDFAIIGGGYSGLWTAYWLQRLEPSASVVVLEREHVGFGASGRNGGWFSALFPASMDKLARLADRESAIAMQRAMNSNVSEVGQLLAAEGIDCDWQQGGTLNLARTAVQERRARDEVEWWRSWGFGDADFAWLERDAAVARLGATSVRGATLTPHCARVHPLKLVRGLAAAAERRGVKIFEGTEVDDFGAGFARTAAGHRVNGRAVVSAVEAYADQRSGKRDKRGGRSVVPVYSLMVSTPPLDEAIWEEVGLREGETFADYRHLIIYGQRTADGRIAFGGRGAPYHFGSAIAPEFESDPKTHGMIWRELVELFPVLAGSRPEHAWGGPLGISRDWTASVGPIEPGVWRLGGYVGDGLGTSALGGRTLAELLTERESERTRLPWVGHRSRRWEPEPWRWLGVNLGLSGMTMADHEERLTGRPSLIAGAFNRLLRS